MLTQRDGKVLSFIREYKSITVNQAAAIFFNNSYESARRRLKQLESNNILKSYTSYYSKEKSYYIDKKLKDHELIRLNFIKEIYSHGGYIKTFELQPRLLKDTIRPDGYVEFIYDNNMYFILLEIDYTHNTDNIKMQQYEKLYKEGYYQSKCYGTFPILIISRQDNSIRYNSKNFDIIYTDYKFSNLDKFLF